MNESIASPKPASSSANREKQERFLELLLPVQKRLESFCFAMARNEAEACDLVGETVLRAYESFEQIRDQKAFLSYLFSIASRLHKRKQWRGRLFGTFDEDGAEQLPYGGTPPDVSPDVTRLYEALGKLPAEQREAIVLFELSGFSISEIQEIQGGSISSIKMRLSRGRKALAELLGVNDPLVSPPSNGSGTDRELSSNDTHYFRFEAAIND